MIEGIFIDVPSGQLEDHFLARATYHQRRAEFYAGKVIEFEQEEAEVESYTGNPVDGCKNRRNTHSDTAKEYLLIAKFLPPNETVRLTPSTARNYELHCWQSETEKP